MDLIKSYYPYFEKDFGEVFSYIIPGMIVGLIGSLLVLITYYSKFRKWNFPKTGLFFLFISYVIIVIQIAYWSREPGSRTDVTLGLGDTWGTTLQDHAYVIENIILFIPFGILFPMLGKRAGRFCIPTAICSSVAIETMQYISKRGYCQLDDIVTNSIGAGIGYLILVLFCAIRKTCYEIIQRRRL